MKIDNSVRDLHESMRSLFHWNHLKDGATYEKSYIYCLDILLSLRQDCNSMYGDEDFDTWLGRKDHKEQFEKYKWIFTHPDKELITGLAYLFAEDYLDRYREGHGSKSKVYQDYINDFIFNNDEEFENVVDMNSRYLENIFSLKPVLKNTCGGADQTVNLYHLTEFPIAYKTIEFLNAVWGYNMEIVKQHYVHGDLPELKGKTLYIGELTKSDCMTIPSKWKGKANDFIAYSRDDRTGSDVLNLVHYLINAQPDSTGVFLVNKYMLNRHNHTFQQLRKRLVGDFLMGIIQISENHCMLVLKRQANKCKCCDQSTSIEDRLPVIRVGNIDYYERQSLIQELLSRKNQNIADYLDKERKVSTMRLDRKQILRDGYSAHQIELPVLAIR